MTPVAEDRRHHAGQHAVAEAVAGAVGGLDVGDPRADHHIQAVFPHPPHHFGRRGGVVGIVAVHQHVDVSFDVGEHAAHDVALALQRLPPHHGAGGAGGGGAVGRVVVVDVDGRVRQGGAKIDDHGRDRHRLVVARDQHRDARSAALVGDKGCQGGRLGHASHVIRRIGDTRGSSCSGNQRSRHVIRSFRRCARSLAQEGSKAR